MSGRDLLPFHHLKQSTWLRRVVGPAVIVDAVQVGGVDEAGFVGGSSGEEATSFEVFLSRFLNSVLGG